MLSFIPSKAWLAAVLCVTLATQSVAAQDISPPDGDIDVPPGDDRIVVATQGVAAPFSGQLFDPATALRWGNRIVRYRMRIHLLESELETQRTTLEDSASRQLQLQTDSYSREITGLRTDLHDTVARYEHELQSYRNPPFYESWGFAFGTGAVVVVVVGVLLGVVLNAMRL